jgi:hypothetical protein
MQPRQEFLVYEPKLLVEGALLENLFNQQFWLLNKKFMVRNSVGAACVRPKRACERECCGDRNLLGERKKLCVPLLLSCVLCMHGIGWEQCTPKP